MNHNPIKRISDIGLVVGLLISLSVMFGGPHIASQPKNVSGMKVRRIKTQIGKRQTNKTVHDPVSVKRNSSSNPTGQKSPVTTFSPNASIIPFGVQTMPSSVNTTNVKAASRIPLGTSESISSHRPANLKQRPTSARIKSNGRIRGSGFLNALIGMEELNARRLKGR